MRGRGYVESVNALTRAAERVLLAVEGQGRLDEPSYRLEHGIALVGNLLGDARTPVRNLLHGTWLGHPVHPPLTDIPVGAWTAAVCLDAAALVAPAPAGHRIAARRCVGLGLLGAGAAAAAGLADWQYTEDEARRVGLVHGLLNLSAAGLMAASWVRRGRGGRRGLLLGLLGYTAAASSAWLGGNLVSRLRIGVDHADRRLEPRQFVDVAADTEVAEGQLCRLDAGGRSVLLTRVHGQVRAHGAQCPHLGGPLENGWLRGDCVVCPWHGSTFSLVDGTVRAGPATSGLPPLDVRVLDGRVQVRAVPVVPTAPPGSVVAAEQGSAGARH